MPHADADADQLAALAELGQLSEQHELPYWVFGGWAVDFHVGRITRPHVDIDIAIWAHDTDRLEALLRAAAWRHDPQADEDGYTSYERRGVRLEVVFLARDPSGEIYAPLAVGRGTWPADSFGNAAAVLDGVHAQLVSRTSLVVDKSSLRLVGEAAEKNRADIASLLGYGLGLNPRTRLAGNRECPAFARLSAGGGLISGIQMRPANER